MTQEGRKADTMHPCKCGDPSCYDRRAADYPLSELNEIQRMVAFMHAIGQDVSHLVDEIVRRNDHPAISDDNLRRVVYSKSERRVAERYRRSMFR